MKKTKKKNDKKVNTNLKQESLDNQLSDLGLEPPKIYRETQKKANDLYERRQDTKNGTNQNSSLTKAEKRQRETKKRKKRRTLRKFLIWFFVAVVVIAVGVTLSLTVFFSISKIEVNGSEIYTADEVTAQCTIDVGENLFLADTKTAKEILEQNLPYIYNAEIKRKLPATIEINVTDGKAAYCVEQDDETYILLDDNFKVLQTTNEKADESISIKNSSVKTATDGQTIVFEDEKIGECLKELAEIIKENNFTEITAIYSNNISDNYVVYDDRIEFKLGTCDDVESKIYKALAACEQLNESNPNATGVMTVSSGKSVYFTED
ncbi:MAG: FtsQ-type POTRA domain-containing protein [Clostridiales bacterium]|nr:FtsQ-type POTRA domain-containing protein [Clostridiales bacterium]